MRFKAAYRERQRLASLHEYKPTSAEVGRRSAELRVLKKRAVRKRPDTEALRAYFR